ncbi:MAG: DUF5057 domain-containing protein [Lachnospiraceae bacterium]|nr:DUF5057 domain-containing protein [Lachnospiraceae bacterium]
MRRKGANGKKRWITASAACVLTAAIVGGTVYNSSNVVYARPSLPGIENIVNNNSQAAPFYILEIVPSYEDARMGYMVAGEEPGNKTKSDAALSDMAYPEQAAYEYLQTGTTTEGTAAFNELKDYAFTFESAFNSGDKSTTPFTEIDPTTVTDAKAYTTYGSMEETDPANSGNYSATASTSLYEHLAESAADTTLSFQQVVDLKSPSDGTGIFYMDYVRFEPMIGTGNADITQLVKVDTNNVWEYPHKSYTDTLGVPYYSSMRYLTDKHFTLGQNDNGTDDITDDFRILDTSSAEPGEGDIVYMVQGDNLIYMGYIYKDTANVVTPNPDPNGLVFYHAASNTDMRLNMMDSSDTSSLAYIIDSNLPYDFYTIREESGTGDAALDKYYIDTVVERDPATERPTFKYTLSEKEPANDPTGNLASYYVYNEDSSVNPEWTHTNWYHKYFYKLANKDPYAYDKAYGSQYRYVHNYSGEVIKTYYYKGGFTNKELFKKEVLDIPDDKLSSVCVDVITKIPSEVTVEDVQKAGLIYIVGGDYDADGAPINPAHPNDMKYDVAKEILTQIENNNKAVVFDTNALGSMDRNYSGGKDENYQNAQYRNLWRLFSYLLLDDMDGVCSTYVGEDDWKTVSNTRFNTAHTRVKNETTDISHVTDSVFVNFVPTSTGKGNAVSTDFTDAYTDAKINSGSWKIPGDITFAYEGFKAVAEDIAQEKFYLEVAGKDVNSFNQTVSKATSIRYILNYGNRRVVAKNKIRVLDIEPYFARKVENGDGENYSGLKNNVTVVENGNVTTKNITRENLESIRDIFDINWFETNVVSDSTKDVEVYGVGTKEFIGKIEDLNENYDLIYIGMDTAYLTTTYENGRKTKTVMANDGKHYVYRHTGDVIYTNNMDGTANDYYYMGGNDITPDKLRELKAYVEAGYAVLLSDEFFGKANVQGKIVCNGVINTDRVDPDSYMYQFITWCKEKGYIGYNVGITDQFEASTGFYLNGRTSALENREMFVKYLNISKLEVKLIEQPPLYNAYDSQDDVHEYLKMNSSGVYTLDYKVNLKNDAATDTTNTSYDCKLYIDHDADGRFESVEELEGVEITNDANGDEMTVDSDGRFHLTTGTTYNISRMVPEGYVGLIPWKLVFYENGRRLSDGTDVNTGSEFDSNSKVNLIRVAVQDYAAIADKTNQPTIRILQLTTGNSNSTNLDLKNDATLKELYKDVIDFKIEVDRYPVDSFVFKTGQFTGKDRLEALYDYDMLVMGFWDGFEFVRNDRNYNSYYKFNETQEAALAIREYALSGRSILFTHDLTSTRYDNTGNWGGHNGYGWGLDANLYWRDVQGMDRYGIVQGSDYFKNLRYNGNELTAYDSKYDTIYPDNSDYHLFRSYSDPSLLRYNSTDYTKIGEIAAEGTKVHGAREFTQVARLNRGQITEYPFRIGSLEQQDDGTYAASEMIDVATTHHQYFQLNLETDYTDENFNDDIVVWYTLSTYNKNYNYHTLNYNDARNNYYIFNKGNITYTGAGHSSIGDTANNAEKKLFVNTLVAAYNAGTHAPYASYKQSDIKNAAEITSMYVPYDLTFAKSEDDGGQGDGWLDDKVTVYFKTINNNLQDNKKPINTLYYIQVPSAAGATLTVGGKYYKQIQPATFKDCTTNTDMDANTSHSLSNARVYKAEFNVSDLMNGNTVLGNHNTIIYTRMSTETSLEDMGSKTNLKVLPAADSMKPLNVNFTELFDLQ